MPDQQERTPTWQSRKPRPLSQVLTELCEQTTGEQISVRTIRDALADRSFATFLVMACLANLLPFPPGSTLVLGVPIVLIALQMIMGGNTVWLPEFFLKRSLSREGFVKLTTRIVPRLKTLELLLKPRYWPFSDRRAAERTIGVIALILGIAVFFPVPLSNWIPAIACAICGLALSERDGIWLAIGIATGIFSLILVAAVLVLGTAVVLGVFGG